MGALEAGGDDLDLQLTGPPMDARRLAVVVPDLGVAWVMVDASAAGFVHLGATTEAGVQVLNALQVARGAGLDPDVILAPWGQPADVAGIDGVLSMRDRMRTA